MSLLEDVFLQDEANEAQELERIIEGDEFEGRPRSDSDENSEKEDEAEEDKRRVDPNTTKTKRVIKNPRFILNPARLTGPRGIQVIPDHFKDFKFKGKGHEREDLDLVLKKLEHWAYRLYPKFQFEDCLKKIETLGKKRPVMVNLHKIRSDQYLTEETVVQKDSSDEEAPPEDEFDKLLQQQIELARSTPAPGSVKKVLNSPVKENRPLIMPKAISSPSISEEQRERMLRNRKLAEERRLARLKNQSSTNDISQNQNSSAQETIIDNNVSSNIESVITEVVEVNTEIAIRRNRSNDLDSSDEDEITVNEAIRADVHNTLENDKDLDKSNDNTEKAPMKSSTDDDNIHNNARVNEEIELPSDNSHKDENNYIETEINEEIIKSNTQDTDCIAKVTKEDDNRVEVNSNNQETLKNHNDNVENIEDLMDVDFSDDF